MKRSSLWYLPGESISESGFAHFHFVLSLGAVIAIFSGIMYFQLYVMSCYFYLY